jgi:hypothetical protein
MKEILKNESDVQELLQELTPGLRAIGYWLGETIGNAIDEVVDFITNKDE